MLLDFILISKLSRIQTCFLTKSMHLLVKLRKHLKGGRKIFFTGSLVVEFLFQHSSLSSYVCQS
jgi:hypothetical protein